MLEKAFVVPSPTIMDHTYPLGSAPQKSQQQVERAEKIDPSRVFIQCPMHHWKYTWPLWEGRLCVSYKHLLYILHILKGQELAVWTEINVDCITVVLFKEFVCLSRVCGLDGVQSDAEEGQSCLICIHQTHLSTEANSCKCDVNFLQPGRPANMLCAHEHSCGSMLCGNLVTKPKEVFCTANLGDLR